MIANTLSAGTYAEQRRMGLTLGELASEYLALRSAKIGTPERARRGTVEMEIRRIVSLHRCHCPGIDRRLREIWAASARRNYPKIARLAQQWERQT